METSKFLVGLAKREKICWVVVVLDLEAVSALVLWNRTASLHLRTVGWCLCIVQSWQIGAWLRASPGHLSAVLILQLPGILSEIVLDFFD